MVMAVEVLGSGSGLFRRTAPRTIGKVKVIEPRYRQLVGGALLACLVAGCARTPAATASIACPRMK